MAWLTQPPRGLLVCPHCFLAVLPSAASTELFISNPSSLVSSAILRMPSCPKHFTRGILTGNPPSLGRGNSRFRGQGQLLGPSAWLLECLHLDREPSHKTCTAWNKPEEAVAAESRRFPLKHSPRGWSAPPSPASPAVCQSFQKKRPLFRSRQCPHSQAGSVGSAVPRPMCTPSPG